MAELIEDLVVVIPGVMGSVLARDGKPVWEPSAGALLRALRTFGRSVKRLALPEGIGDEDPGDGVRATGLMPDLHVLPGIWTAQIGYGALVSWLERTFHLVRSADPEGTGLIPNLVLFPYDWRLSNRLNAKRLKAVVEPALERWRSQSGFGEARVSFICHSMGGLVARRYLECEEGAELTRKLITLGTPFRGSVKSLESLVNGIRKGIGPFGLDLSAFARTLPSLHQLLPAYECVETTDGLRAPHETDLPEIPSALARDARGFHDEIAAAVSRRGGASPYVIHPILGIRQPTFATVRIAGRQAVPIRTIKNKDEMGDGTVARFAAHPPEMTGEAAAIMGRAEQHGSLQSNAAVFDQIYTALTGTSVIYKADDDAAADLGLIVDELVCAGEPTAVTVEATSDELLLQAVVEDESGQRVAEEYLLRREPECFGAEIGPLPPGGYRLRVGPAPGANPAKPVTAGLVVWDRAEDLASRPE